VVTDAFEVVADQAPHVLRASLPHGRRDDQCPGIIGRVTLAFAEASEAPAPQAVTSYQAWPSAVPLEEWYPDEAKSLVKHYSKGSMPAADLPYMYPKVDVLLHGGIALPGGASEVMMAGSDCLQLYNTIQKRLKRTGFSIQLQPAHVKHRRRSPVATRPDLRNQKNCQNHRCV